MLKVLPPPDARKTHLLRVVVVDDHAFMRDLIARALSRTSNGYEVVAAVGSASEAVAACRRFQPDLLVLDINLPDKTGIAILPEIRRASCSTRVLLCTAFPKEDWIDEASRCGAEGFVEKTNSWDDFLIAVDRVGRGHRYFCSSGAALKAAHRAPTPYTPYGLTRRERQVLQLIAHGLTTKEIAAQLSISIPTVESHRAHLLTKTGVRNMAALVRAAIDAGMAGD